LLAPDPRVTLASLAVAFVIAATARFEGGRPWRFGRIGGRLLSLVCTVSLLAALIGGLEDGGFAAGLGDLQADLTTAPPAAEAATNAPDIFVLLLDAFPGDDAAALAPSSAEASILRDGLAERGFEVVDHSRSNYLLTRLTIASVFSADLLDDVEDLEPAGNDAADARALRQATNEGIAWSALGEAGYERFALTSSYVHVGPDRADHRLDQAEINEFEAAILRTTGAGKILDLVNPDLLSAETRARVAATLKRAASVAREAHERPRFVFAHVPAPHVPWVLDADGRAALDSPESRLGTFEAPVAMDRSEKLRRTYAYGAAVSRIALETVDRVRTSPRPTVVVVFSDHGPDTGFDQKNVLGSDLDERSSNLLAVLAPGHPDLFPAGTTPVNIFPYMLNAYLGTNLPIRANTTWAWRGDSVLDFVELDSTTWMPK
jgi:hypothetical protein